MWLQDIAWTEAEVSERVAERVARAHTPHEAAELQAEPMFCMETAVKLHHWSYCAYRQLQGEAAEREERKGQGQGQAAGTGLNGWSESGLGQGSGGERHPPTGKPVPVEVSSLMRSVVRAGMQQRCR